MQSALARLQIREEEQRRIQDEFSDKRIRYGWNPKDKQFEAWYIPSSSRPYRITGAKHIDHAIYLLKGRLANDRMRAKDLMAQIEEENEKIADDQRQEAVEEVRTELRQILSGRKLFLT